VKLEAALGKIGAEIISEESLGDETVRIMVRIGTSPAHVTAWRTAVTEYLLHAHEILSGGSPRWTADLSRSYFVVGGAKVKYAWRIIISGDVASGMDALSNAVVRGLGKAVELTSFPIIGGATDADPASGRLKGAHALGTADSVISKEFLA